MTRVQWAKPDINEATDEAGLSHVESGVIMKTSPLHAPYNTRDALLLCCGAQGALEKQTHKVKPSPTSLTSVVGGRVIAKSGDAV